MRHTWDIHDETYMKKRDIHDEMSHVCRGTHKWDTWHVWESYMTHLNESWLICVAWLTRQIWLMTHSNVSCNSPIRVTSNDTFEWVMTHSSVSLNFPIRVTFRICIYRQTRRIHVSNTDSISARSASPLPMFCLHICVSRVTHVNKYYVPYESWLNVLRRLSLLKAASSAHVTRRCFQNLTLPSYESRHAAHEWVIAHIWINQPSQISASPRPMSDWGPNRHVLCQIEPLMHRVRYEPLMHRVRYARHALCLIEALIATAYVWLRAWRGADATTACPIFDCMYHWVVCVRFEWCKCHVWIITLSHWLIHQLWICAMTYHAYS